MLEWDSGSFRPRCLRDQKAWYTDTQSVPLSSEPCLSQSTWIVLVFSHLPHRFILEEDQLGRIALVLDEFNREVRGLVIGRLNTEAGKQCRQHAESQAAAT